MPGREEDLNIADVPGAAPGGLRAPALRKMLQRVAGVVTAAAVRDGEIEIRAATTHSLGPLWDFVTVVRDHDEPEALDIACPAVTDGLGEINAGGPAAETRSERPISDPPESRSKVRTLALIFPSRVRSPWLPEQRPLRVRALGVLHEGRVHSSRWSDPGEGTRSHSVALVDLARIADGGTWTPLPSVPVRIQDGTPKAQKAAHTRIGVPPAEVSPEDTLLFTRDAEELRGIAPGKSELLTVFRKVPIELIASVRLAENSSKLQFEITLAGDRTRTRVHDLAAVRDTESSQVHLVPHRSRYGTAQLA